ncbi:MAG TPA: cysteine peptidase family C39 domain-containing protein [Opitutaceae bacterium]|nr:cysteine peptidase family C39 domain-containing protein [Opitutaceae bacterium]
MRWAAGWWLPVPLLLGACASVVPFTGMPLGKEGLYVSGVTPIRQDKTYSCGPACVAAVATHWGVDPAQFESKAPPLGSDTTARDLTALAGDLGLQAFAYTGSLDDLFDNLRQGRPVIAMIPMPLPPKGDLITAQMLELWNEIGPRPAHWVVVVGTIGREWIVIDDPASGPLAVKTGRFQQWWARQQNLSVLIAGTAMPPAALGSNP